MYKRQILSDLYDYIDEEYKHYNTNRNNIYTRESLREILLLLNSICVGSDSRFFNGHTNIHSQKVVTFGVKDLLQANKSLKDAMLFNILSYMSNELLKRGYTVASVSYTHLNAQPKGKIILTKTDKATNEALADVEYELTAKENIYSAVDGSLRYAKGATVAKGKTDANGKLVIDSLFMGKYELKETLTNEGYLLSEKVHQINLEQKDLTTKEYVITKNVTNIAPVSYTHLLQEHF